MSLPQGCSVVKVLFLACFERFGLHLHKSCANAFAQGDQPPAVPVLDRARQDSDQIITLEATVVLSGPKTGVQDDYRNYAPNTSLEGPGGQSGVLTSRLHYYHDWLRGWVFKGSATIDLVGSPTAKAWTTLRDNGLQVESTAAHPCWTTTSCTSSTGWHLIGDGHTGVNHAETVVQWSDNTYSYGYADVSHIF